MAVISFSCNYYIRNAFKNMTDHQFSLLIQKYLSGEANEEEKRQVEQWYESFDASNLEFAAEDVDKANESGARSLKMIREKIVEGRLAEAPPASTRKVLGIRQRLVAAAAVLLLVSSLVYLLIDKANDRGFAVAMQATRPDIQPGGNRAILTLGNGRKIVLDSSHPGVISVQGGMKVVKINSGLLAYNGKPVAGGASPESGRQVEYNTIATPRGGQYQIVLPDGTKVWLNAASSIRFPTAFAGKERDVRITGEAYFEVAQDPGKPFRVMVNDMMVQVLGTRFNINAYTDEAAIRTTLLQGAVKVVGNGAAGKRQSVILEPGEQAQLSAEDKITLVSNVNVNEVIAWKNNLFWFENSDVKEVMKQLSKWYNVDITIDGNISDLFTGSIPRNMTFSQVF